MFRRRKTVDFLQANCNSPILGALPLVWLVRKIIVLELLQPRIVIRHNPALLSPSAPTVVLSSLMVSCMPHIIPSFRAFAFQRQKTSGHCGAVSTSRLPLRSKPSSLTGVAVFPNAGFHFPQQSKGVYSVRSYICRLRPHDLFGLEHRAVYAAAGVPLLAVRLLELLHAGEARAHAADHVTVHGDPAL